MGEQPSGTSKTNTTFWEQPFIIELPPKGKLACVYAMEQQRDGQPVIIEDMARHTAINLSECTDWLRRFIREGIIPADAIAEEL